MVMAKRKKRTEPAGTRWRFYIAVTYNNDYGYFTHFGIPRPKA